MLLDRKVRICADLILNVCMTCQSLNEDKEIKGYELIYFNSSNSLR